MKIGAIVRSYHLTKYLERVLLNIRHFDRIIVANYYLEEASDDTKEICDRLALPNLELRQGSGLDQHEVYNKFLAELSDCDYVFIFDADEFLLFTDQLDILSGMIEKKEEVATAKVIDYVDMAHRLPQRTHRPVVLVKPHVRFYSVRNTMGSSYQPDIYLHHFGYAFDKEELDWKLKNKWYAIDKNTMLTMLAQDVEETTPPQELLEALNE